MESDLMHNDPTQQTEGSVARRIEQQTAKLPSDTFYSLYGIERAGRLSGLRFLGDHDWYREGCAYLVRVQKEDGSWLEPRQRGGSKILCTSFALLFLSKGRTPVLVSKLVHGPGEDWNNDRYDARNLVEYAGRELFAKQPMAWQVFDAKAQPYLRGEYRFRRVTKVRADTLEELVGKLEDVDPVRALATIRA